MERDVVFFSWKRFQFEKIEENDFRLDSHQNGPSQKLKISNLNTNIQFTQELEDTNGQGLPFLDSITIRRGT